MSDFILSRRTVLGALAVSPFLVRSVPAADDDWIELFDGHSLNGWQPSEHKTSWRVENGTLSANGPRSHLFYNGGVHGADFRNFELEVELLTRAGCNSGVYFHTRYQEKDFPQKGFEVQVNNTAAGEGTYRERKKTGSLYGIRNIYKQFVRDDEWFKIYIAVRGKNVQVRLNGMLLVDYTEPTPPVIPDGMERERFLDHGTFALQCHNDGSRASYRNIRVRPLSDDVPAPGGPAPVVDQTFRDIINIGRHNVPMVDFDVRLVDGLTLERALEKSRRDGLEYGVVKTVGTHGDLKNDLEARQWVESMQEQPAFVGLYGSGRGWTQKFPRSTIALFDYVMSDAMTITDTRRRTLQLSDAEQVGKIADPAAFMDMLTNRTVEILETEPIDVLAAPTYLPANLAGQAEALWTPERVDKLIEAAVKNQVAFEINDRFRLPSLAFLQMAKAAGCKFCFGSGNGSTAELRRSEYGLQMVHDCKLDWPNFFDPGVSGSRAVDRKLG